MIKLFILMAFLLTSYSHSLLGNDYSLGEKKIDLYFGPGSPLYYNDKYSGRLVSYDEYNEKLYIQSKIQSSVFDIESFFNTELSLALYCPESELQATKENYTYLVRLLAISYLFEAIRKHEHTAAQMGVSNSCSPNWEHVFQGCSPKTSQMKLFIKNTKQVTRNLKKIVIPFNLSKNSNRNLWINNFNNNRLTTLSQYRLFEHCKKEGCGKVNISKVKKNMKAICQEEINYLGRLCSEEDRIWGSSKILEVYTLLLHSPALRKGLVNGYEAGCLRRFIQVNQDREERYPPLQGIFTFIYNELKSRADGYERGRLFSIGALKEFTDKGLGNIFEDQPMETPLKIATVKEKKKIPYFEKIELPKFIEKKKTKRTSKVKKKKKEVPIKRSSFFIASEYRRKFSLNQVKIEMGKFKYDYTFTLEQEKKFLPIVKKFSSQKSLRDMLKYDKLGSPKAPLPLRFIKYLIDKKMHQGLYNITNVIGEKFYIKNDIDVHVKELEHISIRNDSTTQFKWEIGILK